MAERTTLTRQVVAQSPLSPDEAVQRDQVRRLLDVLITAVSAGAVVSAGAAVTAGTPRSWVATILLGAFAAWLIASPRRVLARRQVESVITRVASALIAVLFSFALLQPLSALVMATALLIPIAAALPFLEVAALRRLMFLAWAGTAATALAGFLPDDSGVPAVAVALLHFLGLSLVSAVVLFLLYHSNENLKASSREFRRLFQLSSDLAEATEPAILGQLIARHLAEATGFEDCVIYALVVDTGRLAPFGSYPAERAVAIGTTSLAERPLLGRVIHDRAQIVVDASDTTADPAEQGRLRTLGRGVMLLLPLVALSDPVGMAELTSGDHHAIDERRLALARTLAFEAAMAIENGRLYQQLRERALHDPLTGLANRNLFFDRVDHALARLGRREEAIVAVLFIDIDDFKGVNDSVGHAVGDRLLTLLADRLRAAVRPADTVARLGGDEFALLLEELPGADEVLAVAERVSHSLGPAFDLAGHQVTVSASIGVGLRSSGGATADELVEEADVAMYEAKRTGKNRVVRFSPALSKVPGIRARYVGSRLGTSSQPAARPE